MTDWSLVLAVMGFVSGALVAAVGIGFWTGSLIGSLKLHFEQQIASLKLHQQQQSGDIRNDFQKALSETRHTLYGRLDQQHIVHREDTEELEKRVRDLEIYRARKNGSDH